VLSARQSDDGRSCFAAKSSVVPTRSAHVSARAPGTTSWATLHTANQIMQSPPPRSARAVAPHTVTPVPTATTKALAPVLPNNCGEQLFSFAVSLATSAPSIPGRSSAICSNLPFAPGCAAPTSPQREEILARQTLALLSATAQGVKIHWPTFYSNGSGTRRKVLSCAALRSKLSLSSDSGRSQSPVHGFSVRLARTV